VSTPGPRAGLVLRNTISTQPHRDDAARAGENDAKSAQK
jgi:hypothetical protein